MYSNENKDKGEELIISEEVIATIVTNTALDVKGVAGMAPKVADISNIFKKKTASKAVKISINDNIIIIDLYISLKTGFKLAQVAEEVQENVKEAVQNMTGYVVSKVNVHIEDVQFSSEDEKKKEEK